MKIKCANMWRLQWHSLHVIRRWVRCPHYDCVTMSTEKSPNIDNLNENRNQFPYHTNEQNVIWLFMTNYNCDEINVTGPFPENDEYLVVADYNQQNIYQLKPDSGEVRAISMSPCHPVSVTFDPSINGLYVICARNNQYSIHTKTFDGRIDKFIFNAPQSRHARHFVSYIMCVKFLPR